MKDKYSKEITRLRKCPNNIYLSWGTWKPLFAYATPKGTPAIRHDKKDCGCLTTIRSGMAVAWTEELTEAIRKDNRIPKLARLIKPSHLPIFAEWQRRIDKELNRA